MSRVIIIFLSLSFLLGQIARIQVGDIAFTLLDLSVSLSFAIWIIDKLLHRQKIVTLSTPMKLFLGFLGLGFFSLILYSTHLTFFQFLTSALYPLRLVVYLSLFYQAKELPQRNREFAIKLMLITGFLVILSGFIQYLFYPVLRNLYYLGWDEHLYRMFSTFLDPNFAGAFFAIFSLFAFENAMAAKKQFKKALYMLLSLSSVLAVFFTYSRTGLIMLLVGVGIYLLLFVNKRVTLLAIGLCVVLLVLTANTKIEGLNPFRIASSKARLESAQHALTIFQRNPLVGVGFNAYRYAQVELGYRKEYTGVDNHADAGTDNSYLFVFATTGILGGSVFASFLILVLRNSKYFADKNYFPARSLFAGLGSVFIGTLFLNILFYPMIIAWLALQAGVIRNK